MSCAVFFVLVVMSLPQSCVAGMCIPQVLNPPISVCPAISNSVNWSAVSSNGGNETIDGYSDGFSQSECQNLCFFTLACLRAMYHPTYKKCHIVALSGMLQPFPTDYQNLTFTCCAANDNSCANELTPQPKLMCPTGLVDRSPPLFNMDINANVMYRKYQLVINATACGDLCMTTSGCVSAVLSTSSNICYLKSEPGTLNTRSGTFAISFSCCSDIQQIVGVESLRMREQGQPVPRSTLKSINSQSLIECAMQCTDNNSCQSYDYATTGSGICKLFSDQSGAYVMRV